MANEINVTECYFGVGYYEGIRFSLWKRLARSKRLSIRNMITLKKVINHFLISRISLSKMKSRGLINFVQPSAHYWELSIRTIICDQTIFM